MARILLFTRIYDQSAKGRREAPQRATATADNPFEGSGPQGPETVELQSNQPTDDPRRRLDLARSARQGMERMVEQIGAAQAERAEALLAAKERVSHVRSAQQELVQELREQDRARRSDLKDRVELSEIARTFVGDEEDEAARAELVDSLKAAHLDDRLHTRERIERAAGRLLGA